MLNEQTCPICKNIHPCHYSPDKNFPNCWCAKESFPQKLFEHVPKDHLYKTCVCKECMADIKKQYE
ncbi:cysteine-rich CWC family protein [Siminovitchia sediminis]|uniref:Cysteine-rich CWC family protein n=1 Tax=Siminovitchia sediminis TaxID=1274353 RepID=A0ABW4KEH2_9BACI